MKKTVAVFLAAAFVMLTLPVRNLAASAPGGSGALTGYIFDEDMKTPVRNAVVKLRNVATLREYESERRTPSACTRSPRSLRDGT
jgi:hypothetical protein